MKKIMNKHLIVLALVTLSINNNLKSQTNFIWGKQFGTDREEYSMNHVNDNNGNTYISGKTTGKFNGINYGKNDGFIVKIDSLGNTVWSQQFGSIGEEDILWSAIDDTGNVYITGSTTGILGTRSFGKEDIFIVKYNASGEREWMKQFGSDSTDIAKGVYADNKGSIYLTGVTLGKIGNVSLGKGDCFIMKLDSKGNHIFTSQFGTSGDDQGYAITGMDSDIFVCGTTWGALGKENKGFIDAFAGHFTDGGDLVRYYQFGTEGFDIGMILNVDNERNIYIGGTTSGNLGCQQIGGGDSYLLKISPMGDILWKNQFGTKNNDGVRGIDFCPNGSDNVIVSGIFNLPPGQGFIRMYEKDGGLMWEQKYASVGKNGGTSGKDVTIDKKGNIFHVGLTGANLFGPLIGEHDVYLVKLKLE